MTRLGRFSGIFVCSFMALVFGRGDAVAQGVEAQIRCFRTVGDAEIPLDPMTLTDLGHTFGCTVQWSNGTGQDITGARFALSFGQHPLTTFTVHPDMPEDIGARLECPTVDLSAGTFRPRMVLNLNANFAGFVAGARSGGDQDRDFGRRCGEFDGTEPTVTWTNLSLPAGQLRTGRVEFRPGYLVAGQNFETQIRLEWTNRPADISYTTATLPFVVSVPAIAPDVERLENHILHPEASFAGAAYVGTRQSLDRPSHTGFVGELVLPFLRPDGLGGYAQRIDDTFDAASGDILLHDPTDLELGFAVRRHIESNADIARGWRDASDGTSGWAGQLELVAEQVAPNRFIFPYGYLSGTGQDLAGRRLRVVWAARWSNHPAVTAWLNTFNLTTSNSPNITVGHLCSTTDQSPRTCSPIVHRITAAARFMVGANAGHPLIRTTDLADRPNLNRGRTEDQAFVPGANHGISVAPPFAPWRDMTFTTYWQGLGNSDGDRTAMGSIRPELSPTRHPVADLADVAWSDGAGDFGAEADLRLRALPTGTEWTPSGFGAPLPEGVREFRSVCTPSRYGVRTAGSNPCEMVQPFQVPFDVRSSIDESVYDEFNMTRASLGTIVRTTAANPAWTEDRTSTRAVNIEVDGRSRLVVRPGRGTMNPLTMRNQQTPFTEGIGNVAPLSCITANMGLGNAYGPVELTLHYPVGWRPTTGNVATDLRLGYTQSTLTFGSTDNTWNLTSTMVAPIPADRIVTQSHDPVARTFSVTVRGPGEDQRFIGEDEIDTSLGYGSVRTLGFAVEGLFVPGTARQPEVRCEARFEAGIRSDNTEGPVNVTRAPRAPYNLNGVSAPSIRGLADRARAYGWSGWNVTIDMRNTAYNANGTLLTSGGRLAARDAVAFLRVPRDGDYDEGVENGTVLVTFEEATPPAGFEVWVSGSDEPNRGNAPEVASSPDWVFCAPAGETCDAAALVATGLGHADVRWVALVGGELPVTDAEPQGVAPLGGNTRVENPLLGHIHLRDAGSSSGARARPVVEFTSPDSLRLVALAGPMDVVIDAWCDSRLLSVGCSDGVGQCRRGGDWICDDSAGEQFCTAEAGEPEAERCDELDWDCNGEPLNGFTGLGSACAEGVGECTRSGVRVCAADGSAVVCGAVPGEPQSEFCNGLDDDCNGATDDTPGSGEACSVGVGQCTRPGVTACNREGGSTLLCIGEAGEPTSERCDNLDWDCDGNPYNGFDAFGVACAEGDGVCRNVGVIRCNAAGTALECSVQAGDPTTAEVCDGSDNNCSGEVDDLPGRGDACFAGLGECRTAGTLGCAAGAGPDLICVANVPEGLPERCDDRDWDCDGDPRNGYPVGEVCSVEAPRCSLAGIFVCALDGNGVTCDTGAAECPPLACAPNEGRPCTAGVGGCRVDGVTRCDPSDENAVICAAEPGSPAAETCNGIDDDCNGIIDDTDEDCSCDGLSGVADICPGAWTPVAVDLNANGIGDSCECDAACRVFIDGCVVDGTTACERGEVSGICRPDASVFDAEGRVRSEACTVAECGAPECDGPDADGDGLRAGDAPGCDPCPDVWDPAGNASVCACQNEGQSCSVKTDAQCFRAGELVCRDGEDRARCVEGPDETCSPTGCVLESCDEEPEPAPCKALEGGACTEGVGVCAVSGTLVCDGNQVGVVCDATAGRPVAEVCNGLDDDCDGQTDEGDVCAQPGDDAFVVTGGGGAFCGGGGNGFGLGALLALLLAAMLARRGARPQSGV